jgi:hypothetical protein
MKAHLTDGEKGYVAGFLDGEGCIGIGKRSVPTKHRPFRWVAFSSLCNTNRVALDYIQQLLKRISRSHCNVKASKPSEMRKHTLYTLTMSSMTLKPLLLEIKDHLIIKRRQAELLLSAFPLLSRNRWDWDPENDVKLERIYQELRSLNKGAKLKSSNNLAIDFNCRS